MQKWWASYSMGILCISQGTLFHLGTGEHSDVQGQSDQPRKSKILFQVYYHEAVGISCFPCLKPSLIQEALDTQDVEISEQEAFLKGCRKGEEEMWCAFFFKEYKTETKPLGFKLLKFLTQGSEQQLLSFYCIDQNRPL